MIITEPLVRKLLATVDVGLTAGMGVPEPGKMCVEAAIAYALGLPHTDWPSCVHSVVRAGKIELNDASWSSDLARARGMRRVAIAQLGSEHIDFVRYVRLLAEATVAEIVPLAAESAESAAKYAKWAAESAAKSAKYAKLAAESAAKSAKYAAKYAAKSAEYAAKSAKYAAKSAGDVPLRLSADLMVRALQACGSPGCDWLWICDEIKEAP